MQACDLLVVDRPAKITRKRRIRSRRCLHVDADETMRLPSPATDQCDDDVGTKRTWQRLEHTSPRHGAPTTCSSRRSFLLHRSSVSSSFLPVVDVCFVFPSRVAETCTSFGNERVADSQRSRGDPNALPTRGFCSFAARPLGKHLSMLRKEVERTPRCAMRARRYVVAWNGVLTLAYEGLPRPLVELKARLRDASAALPAENPGSLWPKTTVAALRDDVRLTPEQLETLLEICEAMANDVEQEDAFEMTDLDLVVYECRSLEKRISQETMPLDGSQDVQDAVDAVEKSKVQRVVDEAKDPQYWFHASKDGCRASHYRSCAPGATLVHSLKSPPTTLDEFRTRVEHAMPGLYTWFAAHSLHITLRAILS